MFSSADVFQPRLEQRHHLSGFSFDSVALVTFRVTWTKFIQSLCLDETEVRFWCP